MTDNRKMTKAELFANVYNLLNALSKQDEREIIADMRDGIKREYELVIKKSKDSKTKLTPNQKANLALKNEIFELIGTQKVRVGDIATALNLTPQKVTALVTQMVKDDVLVREVDNKTALYSRKG